MQTDKALINQIKETYSMEPRPDFVLNTELELRKAARKMKRKRTFKLISLTSSGFILSFLAILWIFSFNGKETIENTLSSFVENNPLSVVKNSEPLVYIYHSHNQESFISETKTKDPNNEPYHPTRNISLVGNRFSQALKERNISSVHDTSDTMGILQDRGLSYDQSYSVSRESLEESLKNNPTIEMIFDIHRDSNEKNGTTAKINGEDFARIAFVVFRSNVKDEDSLKFAQHLHKIVEGKYPGLSRGVLVKTDPNTQNTYNQDLKNQSVLLEIGGVENTLEEEYRTADALAEVVEELLKYQK
ncbi:stage II sporulation protein P [Cytobacillus firmus]|uniref:stage II sporulation protein P n=1 Tax=Cytobacillus firmus TaxID=1399 RepID=UPI00203A88CF|nr:stage II sporulation protein P [Cytobacillus firmus]MCM3705048.1 stage II sporulation protein P [Cytobacillus firmus]